MPKRIEKGFGDPLASQPLDDLDRLAHSIGHQVRAFRRQQGMTAVDCAKQANLSPAIAFEDRKMAMRGRHLATFAFAVQGAGCTVYEFFSAIRGTARCVLHAGGSGALSLSGVAAASDICTSCWDTGSAGRWRWRRTWSRLTDESEEFPLFQHAGTEFIYMLEGEVIYQHADEQFRLRPGDSLFFDGDVPHGPGETRHLADPVSFDYQPGAGRGVQLGTGPIVPSKSPLQHSPGNSGSVLRVSCRSHR